MQEFLNTVINWATHTGVKIIIALVILFIAFTIMKSTHATSRKLMTELNRLTAVEKLKLASSIPLRYTNVETTSAVS